MAVSNTAVLPGTRWKVDYLRPSLAFEDLLG